jgi:uncharacterized membrane protein YidH (DUF202 family)
MWILLALGQALDVLTFLIYTYVSPHNGTSEQNFLIAIVLANFGILGIVLLKLGYTAWLRFRLNKAKFFWPLYVTLSIAAASGFVGALFNTYAIFR